MKIWTLISTTYSRQGAAPSEDQIMQEMKEALSNLDVKVAKIADTMDYLMRKVEGII